MYLLRRFYGDDPIGRISGKFRTSAKFCVHRRPGSASVGGCSNLLACVTMDVCIFDVGL